MADATQPENYSADNDPCPICLCSFDRVDVSELQFPFRGPDRRRGFASERYGGQYRYSYACHIRIITRTGGRNDEKRMKKKRKKPFEILLRNILVYIESFVRILTPAHTPSRWVSKDWFDFSCDDVISLQLKGDRLKSFLVFDGTHIRSTPACRSIMSASEQHVVSA